MFLHTSDCGFIYLGYQHKYSDFWLSLTTQIKENSSYEGYAHNAINLVA